MFRGVRRFGLAGMLVAVALPLLAFQCPFLVFKICLKNNTNYDLISFFISPTSAASWGDNQIASKVGAGSTGQIEGVSQGTYDFQANFDDKDNVNTNDQIVISNQTVDTTNLCITFISNAAGAGHTYITYTVNRVLKLEDAV
ncbi:MAG: hypothetical protein AMXMBFR84_29970 [Candidatus Hydrogenedentota bacterium]